MQVYVAPEVAEVEALHPYLKEKAFRALPIREQLRKQASVLQAAYAAGDRRVRVQLCWWPVASGRPLDEVMNARLDLQEAQLTMAREHGFRGWYEVDALGNATLRNHFELALDELQDGEIEKLRLRLDRDPQLVTEQSAYGHQATLLHYLAANGVESHRQRMPLNAAVLADLLIGCGANLHAKANMYGGGPTPYALASSSAHPRNAGISVALNRVLSGEGIIYFRNMVNGPEDDEKSSVRHSFKKQTAQPAERRCWPKHYANGPMFLHRAACAVPFGTQPAGYGR